MPPSRTASNGNAWHRNQVTSDTPRANASTGNYQRLARDGISTTAHTLDDSSKSRYFGQPPLSLSASRIGTRTERSPDSTGRSAGRRPSIPEPSAITPSRTHIYRPSNLSYSAPRNYNSSPLIDRSTDGHVVADLPRADGTESTISTAAPSTVWDELEDLKSRIRKLELTGKLPPSSGAAISNVSADRPPTAATTVTTMSSSPKHGRGNSLSPSGSAVGGAAGAATIHPLLHSALAKSKPLLSNDVYKALEAAASDALSLAVMMGSTGQPGVISSTQSVLSGSNSNLTDRQVRRKADSMCRSLTELCLALTQGKSSPSANTDVPATLPGSRDTASTTTTTTATTLFMPSRDGTAEPKSPVVPFHPQQRNLQDADTDLARPASSSRALSRLEARRSSLIALSSGTSPRNSPGELLTPTQASSSPNRRTSLLGRSRRAGTEEPEDETRFRAPSRAATDVGYVRQSPREYTSQHPLPSGLPTRKQFGATNTPTTPVVPNTSGRRFLDRNTPPASSMYDRDAATVNVSKLPERTTQRLSSIGTFADQRSYERRGSSGTTLRR
jgi:hypothetical protein